MKAREVFFHELARKMPAQNFQSTYKSRISGEDVLLGGTKEIEGQPVDSEKEYTLNVPIVLPVNHERRIRRAFKSHGKDGVLHYCRKYIAPHDHEKLQTIINSAL